MLKSILLPLLLLALNSSATPLDARATQCADANAQYLKASPVAATKFCQSFSHMSTVTKTTTTTTRPVVTSTVSKEVKTITRAQTTTEFEFTTSTETSTLITHPTTTCHVLYDDPNNWKRSTPAQPTPQCLQGRQPAAVSSACKCLGAPLPTITITKTATLPTTTHVTKSVTKTVLATTTFTSTIPFFDTATVTVAGSPTTVTAQVGSNGYFCTPGIFYREEFKMWSMGRPVRSPNESVFIPGFDKFFICDTFDPNGCITVKDCMNRCADDDFCRFIQYGEDPFTQTTYCAFYQIPPSSGSYCGCQAFSDPNCVNHQFARLSLDPPKHC